MSKDKQKTPRQLALAIAEKNALKMKQESTNRAGQGGGEQNSRHLLMVLQNGLCASCARLSVDPSKNSIGCSFDLSSPSSLARMLGEYSFLRELQCEGFLTSDDCEVMIDDKGIVRYDYRDKI